MDLTDEEFAGLLAGDLQQTRELVRRNSPWMLALATRLVGNSEDAQDVVQSAFGKIFTALDDFEGRAQVSTWMHRIVVNESLMHGRRNRARREVPIEQLQPKFDQWGCREEGPWASLEEPESLMERQQLVTDMSKLLDQLPDDYRTVLILRDVEGMTTDEVAETLSISTSNVKVRLHRARSAAKKILEPYLRGDDS